MFGQTQAEGQRRKREAEVARGNQEPVATSGPGFSLHLLAKFNFLLVLTSVNLVASGVTLGKY